tara:strand:- start:154 stop:1947 length:1794 start_codon:yes stop_codon:yes gene_type:complete
MYTRLIIIVFICEILFPDNIPDDAAYATWDYKIHNVGQVEQVITNMGYLGFHCPVPGGHIQQKCVYPRGTTNSFLYSGGMFNVVGIRNGQKLCSTSDAWSSNSSYCAYEFFPSEEPWDTLWTVGRNEIISTPYLQNYKGLADQNFIFTLNDYSYEIPDQVQPLYMDVIIISHAWSSHPFDDFILFEYFAIPSIEIEDAYFFYYAGVQLQTGAQSNAFDNLVYYDEDRRMLVVDDQPGGGDDEIGIIGYMLFQPDGYEPEDLNWTFNNTTTMSHEDEIQYDITSSGISQPSMDGCNGASGCGRVAFGPLDLSPGDTIHYYVAEVFGEDIDDFEENADRVLALLNNNFNTPGPPPSPQFRVEVDNHKAMIDWSLTSSGINPEVYQDPFRMDDEPQPFEGYRLYKSNYSADGPFTMLAEYDIADNGLFNDVGLGYEYIDDGLLNNFEYYYSVTAFSKVDKEVGFLSQESSISGNAKLVIPGTGTPETVGQVAVVPNPYRSDLYYHTFNPPWEKPEYFGGIWVEQDRRIQFINLPQNCTVQIYTVSGDEVIELQHNNINRGFIDWNLTSSVGQTVAGGIYLFSVEDNNNGKIQIGKFVIVK